MHQSTRDIGVLRDTTPKTTTDIDAITSKTDLINV